MRPSLPSSLPAGDRFRAPWGMDESEADGTAGEPLAGRPRYVAVSVPRNARPFSQLLNRPAARTITDWTRERFTLGKEIDVQVTEIACRLPGCPPLQTVVSWQPAQGPARRFKVFRPLSQVVRDDLPPPWMRDRLPTLDDEESCC